MEHLLENVEQLFLRVETDLRDAILVLPGNETFDLLLDLVKGFCKLFPLHVDVKHLFAQNFFVFDEVDELGGAVVVEVDGAVVEGR